MSARELLRQFRALSTDEQKKFLRKARTSGKPTPDRTTRPARKVKWPDVESRAKRITGERVLPNLILVERDAAHFADTLL